jgi:drug/metabolite transporter (DMT)-like permease
VTAVILALLSALSFGSMTVALRLALRRVPDAELGAAATLVAACGIALAVATAEAPARGVGWSGLWPFALAGILAPGGSQLLFTLAVRDAGASRTSVVVGAAPLVSVAIALTALSEPLRPALIVGAVLIVVGGLELTRESDRPDHVRLAGLAFAFAAAVLFASRDNLVRWLAGSTAARPGAAAFATLLLGALVAAAFRARSPVRTSVREAAAFVPAGVFFGCSYVLIFEAYYRGRVTVVSPLVATESLWGVLLSVVLLRHSELVGRRLVLGACLIVAGGVLIGAFR